MAKLTKKTKQIFQGQNMDIVTEYTGQTSYLEEDISVPEELVQNKSLVRMEINIEKKIDFQLDESSQIKKEIKEDEHLILDLERFNSIIEESLDMYKVILQLNEAQIYKLKKEILVNLGVKFITKKLTIKDINLEISNKLK